ncbi:hypothetical protein MLD38_008689 [Melastoma candidum]|uniref:Uncharacterized protein n=1 Tax=Melastoma candidum TaxID=119954 RepID=A0ACB9RU98_9MYRT|nr:hypothetical protein MLD38_008689 [Melastoma candidum]
MAVVSDVEAVLEFLRRNGFGESEVALRRELLERDGGHCPPGSCEGDDAADGSDYEKFLFPMSPHPPALRVPAAPREGDRRSCKGVGPGRTEPSPLSDAEEDFVSLGSSSSGFCSSEFTNPYGRQSRSSSAAGDSEASYSSSSSERTSQFGTARACHVYDWQDDSWFDEKEDGLFMTPSFQALEPEDKFITSPGPTMMCFKDDAEKFLRNGIDYPDKPHCFSVGEDEHCKFELRGADWSDLPGADILEHHSETKEMVEGNRKPLETCEEDNCHDSHDLSGIEFNAPIMVRDDGKAEYVDHLLAFGENDKESSDQRYVTSKESDADCKDEALLAQNHGDDYEMFDLRIIHRRNWTGFEENKDLPIVLNTVISGRYYVTEYLGSAAFSKVIQAHDLQTGVDVCLKIIKNDKDFFDQSLDEIKLLKLVNKHDPNDQYHILRLYDYFYHREHLFIVCELLNANLYEFQKYNKESGEEPYFTFSRLQIITRQCLEALEYLHELGIIHCDLKPENILIKSYSRSQIKVIDLGSSCFKSDNLSLYVQSRSYRAPEVILGLPYDEKIDIWSLGCILVELCSGEVLFPNERIVMILARIIGLIGPIEQEMLDGGQETSKYFTEEYHLFHVNEDTDQTEYVIPRSSSLGDHIGASDLVFLDFLKCLLVINPARRPTAREALEHPWLSYDYSLVIC